MQIPNAETIEAAIDTLPQLEPRAKAEELEELTEAVGADSAAKMGIAFPVSEEFKQGYVLGLQVSRFSIAASPEVLMHGADPDKVL